MLDSDAGITASAMPTMEKYLTVYNHYERKGKIKPCIEIFCNCKQTKEQQQQAYY
jgi:hypothetical protein